MNPNFLVRTGLLAVLIQAATMQLAMAAAPATTSGSDRPSLFSPDAKRELDDRRASQVASLGVDFDAVPATSVAQPRASASIVDGRDAVPAPEASTWALLIAGAAGVMVLKRHQLRRRS